MKSSVIVSACRTPIGGFQGSLSGFKTTDLGAIVIKEAVVRAGLKSDQVENVIMGCVLPAGLGQAPARQAALAAGLPNAVEALTVNKVCSSGLIAVAIANQYIMNGESEIVVAGGMESMTNAPYLIPQARQGLRMGDGKIVDGMVFDGLWNIYSNSHMGSCAEMCSTKYNISREEQDAFAVQSYKKAIDAQQNGKFDAEIVSVAVYQKKGEPIIFTADEEPEKVKYDKIPTLKPSFKKDGTITAANSSSVSDGASALVIMSEDEAKKNGVTPLARIICSAGFSHEPEWFTTAPIEAIRKVVKKAGLKLSDIDLFEINEAFAVQTLAVIKDLGIDQTRLNVNGGAVALGHPIGCSGARILTTLLYAMKDRGAKIGLASLCNGGGEATAMIVESFFGR